MKNPLFCFLVLQFFLFTACGGDDEGNNSDRIDSQGCAELSCDDNASCVIIDDDQGVCACNVGYAEVAEECRDEMMADCLDEAPENATSEVTSFTIAYDIFSGWEEPPSCDWFCDEGYVRDASACIELEPEVPLDGFGLITGGCGEIEASQLNSSDPFYFLNTIDFLTDTYDASDFYQLTEGGQTIATTVNAGGSSIWSEVFSFEVLARCELASLLKTKTEISYNTQSPMTDIVVSIDGLMVGVSATRAMSFPRNTTYDPAQALSLLTNMLEDIRESTAAVSSQDLWAKQILHIITDRDEHVPVIESALALVDPEIRGDTIVIVTVTEGVDDFIYTNET